MLSLFCSPSSIASNCASQLVMRSPGVGRCLAVLPLRPAIQWIVVGTDWGILMKRSSCITALKALNHL
jgi:hypothetical protein